jgi:hypothetical protein
MNNIWVDTVLVDGERVTDTALGIESFGGMMVTSSPCTRACRRLWEW